MTLCVNMAEVAIINSGRSRMGKAMHLIRCLSFFLARWDVALVCKHILGTDYGAADALSRNFLPLLVPESAEDATSIPEGILQCLVHDAPDWTKVDWVTLFNSSIWWVWLSLHTNSMLAG